MTGNRFVDLDQNFSAPGALTCIKAPAWPVMA